MTACAGGLEYLQHTAHDDGGGAGPQRQMPCLRMFVAQEVFCPDAEREREVHQAVCPFVGNLQAGHWILNNGYERQYADGDDQQETDRIFSYKLKIFVHFQ